MNEASKKTDSFRLWRSNRPLRAVFRWSGWFVRILQIYLKYREKHPGFNGLKRLICLALKVFRKGGLKGLRRKIAISERDYFLVPVSAESIARQFRAHSFELILSNPEMNSIMNLTIIFDHNGGGGANQYSRELTHNDCHELWLRIYHYEGVWFIEWINDGNISLYYTASIEELFDILSSTHSKSIIINSLYGYPDIRMAVSKIITLTELLNAKLDIKMHDFYALCPSPHLLDYKGQYCGVPTDVAVCRNCLRFNIGWYHRWYPKENRPVDIIVWRTAYEALFRAASVISFFDQSSVDITRKAFTIDGSKIHTSQHDSNYFKCDAKVKIRGPLHIGILGNLNSIKGENVVMALHQYIEEQGLKIPITVVGNWSMHSPPGINVYGKYRVDQLPGIIQRQGINAILMCSIVPETFSYTISESMKMGLPIVTFDLGAQGNRVSQYSLGKVVPYGSTPQDILDALRTVLRETLESYQ